MGHLELKERESGSVPNISGAATVAPTKRKWNPQILLRHLRLKNQGMLVRIFSYFNK
jgi:hypothetical protein